MSSESNTGGILGLGIVPAIIAWKHLAIIACLY